MRISVTVKTNSRTEGITKDNDTYLVKVKEPPREGKANSAVIKLLAGHFKVSKSSVKIISGAGSRNKIIEIGLD